MRYVTVVEALGAGQALGASEADAIRQLADPAGFRPWLLAIAHNVLTDAARRDARLKRSEPVVQRIRGAREQGDRDARLLTNTTADLQTTSNASVFRAISGHFYTVADLPGLWNRDSGWKLE